MPSTSPRIGRYVCAAVVLASVFAVASPGQDKGKPGKGKVQSVQLGASGCLACHSQPTLPYTKTGPQPQYKGNPRTSFLRLTESTTWANEDLHSKAYEALESPLGKNMSRLLGYDVAKSAKCLTCHSVDLHLGKAAKDKTTDDFYLDFGVSCEGCHGFATEWNTPHEKIAWRNESPKAKEEYGQWDMRDPKHRAERCTSCHVGNLAEGRFVTHDMYAAGHPPLPPLEVMRHSFDQPAHYDLGKNLEYFQQLAKDNPAASWNNFHYRTNESQVARQVAIGAVMALRASMKLIADEAASGAPVLDLAQFDCAACHHDLKADSWRQKRGFAGIPGRSQPRYGQTFLARLVVDQIEPGAGKKFRETYDRLTKAFDARPFGDPKQVLAVAKDLVAWCDSYTGNFIQVKKNDTDQYYTVVDGSPGKFGSVVYDQAKTKALILAIAEAAKAPPSDQKDAWVDFDTAQQLVWAVESLRSDLDDESLKMQIGDALRGATDKLPRRVLPPTVRTATNLEFIAKTDLKARFDRTSTFKPEDLFATMAKIADLTK